MLYNHFADKEELLALALHQHVRDVEDRLGRPRTDGTLSENLHAFITHALAAHTAFLTTRTADLGLYLAAGFTPLFDMTVPPAGSLP